MSDVNLSITEGDDIYLSITETPTVVSLSAAVVAGGLIDTVTVGNVVTVNVATMPALSISSVTVSNFPATQVVSVSNLPAATTVTGTVALDTASLAALESITVTVGNVTIGSSVTVSNLTTLNNAVGTDGSTPASNNFVKIGGHQDGNNSVEHIAHVSAGGALKVDASDSVISGTVTVGNLPTKQFDDGFEGGPAVVSELVTAEGQVSNANPLPVFLPIGGTVTANVLQLLGVVTGYDGIIDSVEDVDTSAVKTVIYLKNPADVDDNKPVSSNHPLPVRGVVTVGSCVTHGVTIANSSVTVNGTFWQATQPVSLASLPASTVTVSSLPAISGTVTANSIYPKVTFIDGSGSVVTANSAVQVFATSSTRSYLLVQVTTGSAYVNVGATATTANGIYLGTGQGYAWETTIPQGIVSLISSVTGTAYCAKQA